MKAGFQYLIFWEITEYKFVQVSNFLNNLTKSIQNLISGDDYHTNWNPYHTDKNGFVTHGVYHIDFLKRVKNRVITQLTF